MNYGDIFAGTFRTLWRHKTLWLLSLLGRILPALTGLLIAVVIGRLLANALPALAGNEPTPSFVEALAPAAAGFGCLLLLLLLVGYVIGLIMRGAVINEAGMAWSGDRADPRRGISAGAGRAVYLFGLDLLWYVPILVIAGGAYVATAGVALTTVVNIARSGRTNAGLGAMLLGICGAACCLVLLLLAIAVFYGIFAPLMYQSAVQPGVTGRRHTLGEAISEGWGLARDHVGPMIVFWLLVGIVSVVGGVLMRALTYPLSSSMTGEITAYVRSLAGGGGNVPPPPPPGNLLPLVIGGIVIAILGLIVYSFVDAFNLTLYAAVYRRLSGASLSASLLTAGSSLPPEGPSGLSERGPDEPPPVPPIENPPATGPAPGAETDVDRDVPGDLGLNVPGDGPPNDEPPVA